VLIAGSGIPRPHGRGYPLSPLRGCLPALFMRHRVRHRGMRGCSENADLRPQTSDGQQLGALRCQILFIWRRVRPGSRVWDWAAPRAVWQPAPTNHRFRNALALLDLPNAYIHVTYNCNLTCAHCSARSNADHYLLHLLRSDSTGSSQAAYGAGRRLTTVTVT
jgi:hypothetical protein